VLLASGCWLQVATNKRYAGAGQFTVSEVAQRVKADIGNIDIVVSQSARQPADSRAAVAARSGA
jgi:hypothetical protein